MALDGRRGLEGSGLSPTVVITALCTSSSIAGVFDEASVPCGAFLVAGTTGSCRATVLPDAAWLIRSQLQTRLLTNAWRLHATAALSLALTH